MIRLRIKEVAEQHGIRDVTVLAARAGIAYATAYRLWKGDVGGTERGERSIGIMTLYRVAKALGVHTSDLYAEDDGRTLAAALVLRPTTARVER